MIASAVRPLPVRRPGSSLPPAVRFANAEARARTIGEAEGARAIVLIPQATEPGRLGAAIDADLESVLASRGALPSRVTSDAAYELSIDDQIGRAASLPVRGICLCMPRLSVLVADGNELDLDDARTLHAWIEAARSESRLRLVVLLHEEDLDVRVRVPTRMEDLVAGSRRVSEAQSTAPTTEMAEDDEPSGIRVVSLIETRAVVEIDAEELLARVQPSGPAAEPVEIAPEVAAEIAPAATPVEIAPEVAVEVASAVDGSAAAPLASAVALADYGSVEPKPVSPAEETEGEPQEAVTRPRRAIMLKGKKRTEQAIFANNPLHDAPPALEPAPAPAPRREDPKIAADKLRQLRAMAAELDEARGPRPVATIEKLFATKYIPLLGAAHRGECDSEMEGILQRFRSNFSDSYEAAWSALRVTQKRPPMVMDAPEIAQRMARLAGARQVRLVMIDAMGFDLGERVSEALRKKCSVELVDRTTLWAGLPSTSTVQSHLLSRGPDGLRDVPGPSSELEVARGRTVATFRKERHGSRELSKLDLVEARLRVQGGTYDERLDGMADEVSEAVAKFIEPLAPRTLVYLFGDHGFVLPHGTGGYATGPARQGGSSPEEVLVGGFGFLTGV